MAVCYFLCVRYTIKRILKTRIFTCSFQFVYITVHYIYENRGKSLTRLRISAHTLEIERGRYKKLKIEEQLCKTCLKIEDEPHFLLDCNLFKINNDEIRLFMEREVPNFNFMDIKQQFVFLMINEDINIISFI